MLELYYHTCFALILLSCLLIPDRKGSLYKHGQQWSIILLAFAVICISFLPVPWGSGGDRKLYANGYLHLCSLNNLPDFQNDALFGIYQWLCSFVLNYQGWFVLTALIYVGNHYLFAQHLDKKHAYIIFLMFCTGFSFYAYGVNTIRAGFAASFLLLAFTRRNHLIFFIACLLIAINIHFSMALPALCMVIAKYYNKPKLYIGIWSVSILLSTVMGSTSEALFSSLIEDKRSSYLQTNAAETHYKVGFRIDFILYSMAPIAMGWFYLVKKRIQDVTYNHLLNTYILANTFWILVIRANYSDRFAYLSWFLYPAVLIYPALKYKIWQNHYSKIALIVFLHASFTYLIFLR